MSEKPHAVHLYGTATQELPFDSIEGAHEYVRLLVEAVEEARSSIEQDASVADRTINAGRRLAALRVVSYKLTQLHGHLMSSRRILNDLRMLRRVLLGE